MNHHNTLFVLAAWLSIEVIEFEILEAVLVILHSVTTPIILAITKIAISFIVHAVVLPTIV